MKKIIELLLFTVILLNSCLPVQADNSNDYNEYINPEYIEFMDSIENLPEDERYEKINEAPFKYIYNEELDDSIPMFYSTSYEPSGWTIMSEDQGNPYLADCGWAFGCNDALEVYLRKNNISNDCNFSEQHLRFAVDKNCLGEGYKKYAGAVEGNQRSFFKDASAYWMRNELNGPVAEDTLRYSTSKQEEVSTLLASKKEDYQVTNTISLSPISRYSDTDTINKRISLIKELVREYGAVYVSYNHYDGAFDSYFHSYNNNSGEEISDGCECNNGVIILGWDDNYSIDNFGESKPSNDGAFIVKANRKINADFGTVELGNYYLSYNMTPYFDDYGVVSGVEKGKYSVKTFEYDKRTHKGVSYNDSKTVAYANKYNTGSDKPMSIKSITTYVEAPESTIKLFISTDGTMSGLKEVSIDNSYSKYMGYRTLVINKNEDLVVKGDFIAAIQVTSSYGTKDIIPQEINPDEDTAISGRCFVSTSVENMKNGSYKDTGSHNNILKVHTINAKREWNFGDQKFIDMGDSILEEQYTDGLTLGKDLSFRYKTKNVKGVYYNRLLDLKYTSDKSKRFINISVDGPSDIYFIAQTNAEGQARDLEIYSDNLDETSYISVNEASGYHYKYRGGSGNIRVRARNSNVRIYSIVLENYYEYKYDYLEDYSIRKWTFDDRIAEETIYGDKDLGKGLNILATQNMPVSIIINNTTNASGFKYNNAIDLKSAGTTDYRSIALDVYTGNEVYVVARNLSGVNRDLIITDKYCCNLETEGNIQSFSVIGDANVYKFKYIGDSNTIYMRSSSGALRIYGIVVKDSNRKITDEVDCKIDDCTELSIGQNLSNTEVNGMTFLSGTVAPMVVQSTDSNYTKAVKLYGNRFDNAGRIKLSISDSSGVDNNRPSRKIRVTAKSAYNGGKIVLANEYGYVYGSCDLVNSTKEYCFDYADTYDDVYLFTTTGNIEIYSISSTDIKYKVEPKVRSVNVKAGEEYRYIFTAQNAPASDIYDYVIEYDPTKLKYVHIGKDNNFTGGNYTDKSISNVSVMQGKITFSIREPIKTDWSGIATSVVFEGIADGNCEIKFSAVRRSR